MVANDAGTDINARVLCQALCGMPTTFFWCCTTLSGWPHSLADELQASQSIFMTFMNNLHWVGLDPCTRPPTAGGSKRKSDNLSSKYTYSNVF